MADDPDQHPQYGLVVPAALTFAVERSTAGGVVTQGRPAAVVDDHGLLPAGALGLLVDHAVGAAIVPRLDPDLRMVTSHMHLELVRPPTTPVLRGTGDVVHMDRTAALVRATIEGDDGTLVALATSRFALFPSAMAQGGMVGDVAAASAAGGPAPPPAHPLTAGHPVHRLLGTEVVAVDERGVDVRVVASPPLANERAGLHGGVGALVGERTGELALRAVRAEGAPMRPVELRVAFVRPVPAVGETLACRADVVHAGRSVAVTRAVLRTTDGRVAVTVDASWAVA